MATKIEKAAKTTATKAKTTNQSQGPEMTNLTDTTTATNLTDTTSTDTTITGADTSATTATTTETTAPKADKPTPKYLIQRSKRQRYSFGNTWLNAVLAGVVTDKDKLVAHGVHVNAGTEAELDALDMEALLKVVQDAIYAEVYVSPADQPQEPTAETQPEAPVVEPAAETQAEETVAA